jgi:hypothetical protein
MPSSSIDTRKAIIALLEDGDEFILQYVTSLRALGVTKETLWEDETHEVIFRVRRRPRKAKPADESGTATTE